ncbi:hypothetical protein [Henriciella aquimarina]|uniref:hypothetical protein n=1 Tax=Henriciella aquimarina TaxID=545261 RepID=UPI0009FCBC8D|nr:hypothetical protein [Henriciella aquimarina]
MSSTDLLSRHGPSVGEKLRIEPVCSRAERKAFVNLPYDAYRHVPNWRPPLRFERMAQLDPKGNPGLALLDHELFLAWRGDKPVGRIAAIINPYHLEKHDPDCGHFGFLDTLEPDTDLVGALTETAAAWLEQRGMTRMAGPFNFSVNEECGLLVDGFDTPPMLMMGHGRPDYATSLETLGFSTAMNMHAYICRLGEVYDRHPVTDRLVRQAERDPGITVRPIRHSHFQDEVALVLDIFNDAWSENWGFIPFSEDQIRHMASELRPLLREDGVWIASVDGEPMAFTLMVPNVNEAIEGLDGRLLPFGWVQLLNRLKLKGTRSARIPLAGVRKAYHKKRRGLAAFAAASDAAAAAQHRRGIREIELSWVLETNEDLISLTRLQNCERYKTYRIYERELVTP